MLTEYKTVNVLLCHIEMLGQLGTKSCGVKAGTGTDDLMLRQSGNLGKYIGQYVNRVTYDNINRIRACFTIWGVMLFKMFTLV